MSAEVRSAEDKNPDQEKTRERDRACLDVRRESAGPGGIGCSRPDHLDGPVRSRV